jgi:O-acetylserine/cysteine efflux transporter
VNPRDIALGFLATLIWSGAFIWTDAALAEQPPLFFAGLRFALTACFVLVIPRPRIPWRTLVLIGLLIGAGQHACIFIGMTAGVPPGVASLLAHTQSFFTIALAVMLLGERLTSLRVVAFVLAACGIALLVVERGAPLPPLAVFSVVAGAFLAALGNLVLLRLGGSDALGVAAWMALVATPALFGVSLLVEGAAPFLALPWNWSWPVVGATLYSGMLSGLVAYAIWTRLFGRYESARVAPFMLLVPVFAITLSMIWTGERFTMWRAIAALTILAGLALNVLASSIHRKN